MTLPDQLITKPKGVLFDFGGTLVAESLDIRAGNRWLLAQASPPQPHVGLDAVVARAEEIGRHVLARRRETQVEIPWAASSRLIYDHFGVQFDEPVADLELGFRRAAIRTEPLPGVRETLDKLADAGIPMAVVSNNSFSERTLRAELERHGLARHFKFVLSSADVSIRKPNPMIFEIAAVRLGVSAQDIWFVGNSNDEDVAGANAAGMTSVLLGERDNHEIVCQPAISIPVWHDWPRWD